MLMVSRKGKSRRGARGNVKKSARFDFLADEEVATIYMCLDRAWCWGLYARSIADLLSRDNAVASGTELLSSHNKDLKYTALFVALEAATTSASHEDRAYDGLLFASPRDCSLGVKEDVP
eukprot:4773923-Pleurochrysis_carterae.AAC.3